MRKRFRLPTVSAFGLYFSVILLLISVPTVMIYSAVWGYFFHSQGFEVHTTVPKLVGSVPEDRLIVTVSNCVNCAYPKLSLNAATITWEELTPTLRSGLSRRNQRVVYLDADESVTFQDVMSVMDAAQQAWHGVSIVLLTPKLKRQIQHDDPTLLH